MATLTANHGLVNFEYNIETPLVSWGNHYNRLRNIVEEKVSALAVIENGKKLTNR